MRYVSCVVDASHDAAPLWRVLNEQLGVSRTLVRRAKAAPGGLLLEGRQSYTTAVVHRGQTVSIDVSDRPDAGGGVVVAEEGPVDVLYEDADLLAVNKPWNQVAHPCPGHRRGGLGNYVLGYLERTGSDCRLLHPVHRLDWGTSGVLLYAKNGYAHERAQAQLHAEPPAQGCGRTYLALCQGRCTEERGVVDLPIVRKDPNGIERAVGPGGKRAVTRYEVVGCLPGDVVLVAVRLETGRTHQIRVHMAHIGLPLLGDPLYGVACPSMGRPALHSHRLRLVHPVTGETLDVSAPLPDDMAAMVGRDFMDAL